MILPLGTQLAREKRAAERVPQQHSALFLTTELGSKNRLMETEYVHRDAHLKMQQHRDTT